MLGDFTYYNPTKLIFGKDAMTAPGRRAREVRQDRPARLRRRLHPRRTAYMTRSSPHSRQRARPSSRMPASCPIPRPASRIARENDVDFILAVGGGSCIDYSKAVAVSKKNLPEGEDPWDVYYARSEEPSPDMDVVPVGSVLTMVGTGSEMNCGSVITNRECGMKIDHVYSG